MIRLLGIVRDHPLIFEAFFSIFLLICSFAVSKSKFQTKLKLLMIWPSTLSTIAFCFLLPISVRVLLLPLQPIPVAVEHDESSYLLAGETFAGGRITNPTPPNPEHFETFHENISPTYHSMYPPAQGIVLAIGSRMGDPWIGVCLSIGALCAAVCWALLPCMPRKYAIFSGIIVALRFGIHSYWIDSYMGGAVAGIGGALVIGAASRILKKPTIKMGLVMGAGIAVLAFSRPFEGLAFAAPICVFVVFKIARNTERKAAYLRPFMAFASCMVVLVTGLAAYNFECTGSPFTLPYSLNQKHYHQGGAFIWSAHNPTAHYSNQRMQDFYQQPSADTSASGILALEVQKLNVYDRFLIFPFFFFLLFGWIMAIHRSRLQILVVSLVSTAAASGVAVWHHPHYLAPALVSVVGLLAHAVRSIASFRDREFARSASTVLAASIVLYGLSIVAGLSVRESPQAAWTQQKKELELFLKHREGKQLILVTYDRGDTDFGREWVFNGPSISKQKIIWARSINMPSDEQLIHSLRPDAVWLLQDHVNSWTVKPYSELRVDKK